MVAPRRLLRQTRDSFELTALPHSHIVGSTVRIRAKIILIVLPLIVTPLVLIALASIFTARNGITRVATEFLRFKAEELAAYAASQWTMLEQNDLAAEPSSSRSRVRPSRASRAA